MVMIKHLDPSTPFESQLKEETGPVCMIETIYVPHDQTEHFLETWREDAGYMKRQPGFISAQLHRGTSGSQLLVNVGVWESTQALLAAFASPEFQSKAAQYSDEIVGYPHVFERIAVEGICIA